MVKSKNEPKVGSKVQARTCLLCEKTNQAVQQLCGYCFKRIQSMKASPPASFDWGLIEAIQKSKARDRKSSAQKLVSEISPGTDKLEVANERLKKENKALYDRLRNMPARKPAKAKLGFKPKFKNQAVQTDMHKSLSQISAIKNLTLKSASTAIKKRRLQA